MNARSLAHQLALCLQGVEELVREQEERDKEVALALEKARSKTQCLKAYTEEALPFPVRVTVKQATRHVHFGARTILDACRAGEIEGAAKPNGGKWLIPLEGLLAWASKHKDRRGPRPVEMRFHPAVAAARRKLKS